MKRSTKAQDPVATITIQREDGTTSETHPVATFNKGFSHFILDDGCYVLIDNGQISAYIFEEAFKVLMKLPKPTEKLALNTEGGALFTVVMGKGRQKIPKKSGQVRSE